VKTLKVSIIENILRYGMEYKNSRQEGSLGGFIILCGKIDLKDNDNVFIFSKRHLSKKAIG
jgi:hypothetical protein